MRVVEEDQRDLATDPVRRRAAESHSAQLLFVIGGATLLASAALLKLYVPPGWY